MSAKLAERRTPRLSVLPTRGPRHPPLRMLRRSFPQKASRRGSSPLRSSAAAGLSSGELGPRLRSSGALVQMGASEDTPEACGRLGERVAVGGGEERQEEGGLVEPGGGEEREGQ